MLCRIDHCRACLYIIVNVPLLESQLIVRSTVDLDAARQSQVALASIACTQSEEQRYDLPIAAVFPDLPARPLSNLLEPSLQMAVEDMFLLSAHFKYRSSSSRLPPPSLPAGCVARTLFRKRHGHVRLGSL